MRPSENDPSNIQARGRVGTSFYERQWVVNLSFLHSLCLFFPIVACSRPSKQTINTYNNSRTGRLLKQGKQINLKCSISARLIGWCITNKALTSQWKAFYFCFSPPCCKLPDVNLFKLELNEASSYWLAKSQMLTEFRSHKGEEVSTKFLRLIALMHLLESFGE